jgi:RNA polymerase sigma-70 factor (ECF subfamily)
MYRITANCASSQLAKRARTRHEELDDDSPQVDTRREHDPEFRASAADERNRVVNALQELPPRLRSVIVLRDIYDLPHEAIAAELGISEAAAKVRLHRARRKLRERLFPLRGEQQPSEGEDAHAV